MGPREKIDKSASRQINVLLLHVTKFLEPEKEKNKAERGASGEKKGGAGNIN